MKASSKAEKAARSCASVKPPSTAPAETTRMRRRSSSEMPVNRLVIAKRSQEVPSDVGFMISSVTVSVRRTSSKTPAPSSFALGFSGSSP